VFAETAETPWHTALRSGGYSIGLMRQKTRPRRTPAAPSTPISATVPRLGSMLGDLSTEQRKMQRPRPQRAQEKSRRPGGRRLGFAGRSAGQ
jgi:hypothetical protein